MTSRQLLLVRHGATAWNTAGRYQGHADIPLSREGVIQAMALRRLLESVDRDAVVHASDLVRARQTAALACPRATIRCDARLRELAFGAFEGLTYEENLRRHGDCFRAWLADPVAVPPTGGETVPQLLMRLDDWLDSLPNFTCVLVFTHGGVIRALLSRARGSAFDPTQRVPPASAVRLPIHDRSITADGVQWLT